MNTFSYDVVCLGGGGAGMLAAITAAELGKKVALVSKEPAGYGNTRLAVGMMTCPGVLAEDSVDSFVQDVLQSGEGLCVTELVETLGHQAGEVIASLEDYGMLLSRDKEGKIGPESTFRTGGHSQARTLRNSGGGAALGALLRGAAWRYNLGLFHDVAVLELIVERGTISGILALDLSAGEIIHIKAPSVVIATGGCCAIYFPHTTNSRGATGDGLALALQAGARLMDMEQVQALPFGVTHPMSMLGALLGETSTAGPAGQLLNGKGQVILEKDIHRMTRAAVVKTMMLEITAGGATANGGLLLDLSPNLKLPGGAKLYQAIEKSGIFRAARYAYGEKAYRWEESWSVLPTMHYLMGGIRVNTHGETGVPGLFACGEVQAGIHGGNRLGSVALSEIFSFGRIAGRKAAAHASTPIQQPGKGPLATATEKAADWDKCFRGNGAHRPHVLKNELQETMWKLAGPVRRKEGLLQGLEKINQLKLKSRSLFIEGERVCNRQLLDALELVHMLPVAAAIVQSALERRESRGAHLRLDYPQKDDRHSLLHTVNSMTQNGEVATRLE